MLWTQPYDNYQWSKDNTLISGATGQFYVVDYIADAGSSFMVSATQSERTRGEVHREENRARREGHARVG
jgi:hypothetical protein